jgi:hypothetical protein
MTCMELPVTVRPPGTDRWAETGSCGAGVMTELGAMFRFPSDRAAGSRTSLGGATSAGCRPAIALDARKSVGGAATEFCRVGELRRCENCEASVGGVATASASFGVSRVISAAGVNGAGGIASRGFCALSDHATIFGRETSRFNFTFGGVTTVCC